MHLFFYSVCYLAEKFALRLQSQLLEMKENDKYKITKDDVLCVGIAGLCHDLGHGPFSHFWEVYVKQKTNNKVAHEGKSIEVFKDIWKSIKEGGDLEDEEKLFFDNNQHEEFICDLILPKKGDDDKRIKDQYKDKDFLFEIVNNETNKLDVDKWDYFARDCHHLGKKNSFDHDRLMQFFRLVQSKDPKNSGKFVLAYRDIEIFNIYHMFSMRWYFHNRYYQHDKCCIINVMFMDAIDEANLEHEKCWRITDSQLLDKLNSKDGIIKNKIDKRQLYKIIASSHTDELSKFDKLKDELEEDFRQQLKSIGFDNHKDIYLIKSVFDFGDEQDDPVKKVRFYGKENPNQELTEAPKAPKMLIPRIFKEMKIICYTKKQLSGDAAAKVKEEFKKWI